MQLRNAISLTPNKFKQKCENIGIVGMPLTTKVAIGCLCGPCKIAFLELQPWQSVTGSPDHVTEALMGNPGYLISCNECFGG